MRRVIAGLAAAGILVAGLPTVAAARPRHHRRAILCAHEPVQTITIVNDAAMPEGTLSRVEDALLIQINTQLCAYWHTPRIRFASGGWQMTLEPANWVGFPPGVGGYHGLQPIPFDSPCASNEVTANCVPALKVVPDSHAMSHELMETLVDQNAGTTIGGWLTEVSDPVNALGYMIDGVRVADFVYPSWFHCHAEGPWDFLHRTFAPLDVEGGNEILVNPDGTMTATVPNNYGC